MDTLKAHRPEKTFEWRRSRAEQLLEQVGISLDRFNAYPHEFSGGMRQRIGIARALYNDPEVLVLDEASSALDITTEGRFLATIKSLAEYKTIIFVTHRESVMKFCDQVYIQKNQKLSKMRM